MASCVGSGTEESLTNDEIYSMRNLPVPQNNNTLTLDSGSSSFDESDTRLQESVKTAETSQSMTDHVTETEKETSVEEKGSVGEIDEVQDFNYFQDQLSTILNRTKKEILNKAEEHSKHVLDKQKAIFKEERERYIKEQNKLHQNVRNLEATVSTLKLIIHKNSETFHAMDKKLEEQQELSLLFMSFLRWRTFVKEAKRQRLLLRLAAKHYEDRLKRKVFTSWLMLFKLNWKKKLELRITMDACENQKAIVQKYEARIRNLEESASNYDRRFKTLCKSFEDSMQMTCGQGLEFSREGTSRPGAANRQLSSEEVKLNRVRWSNSDCDVCASHPSTSSIIESDTPPVNYKYTNELIQIPISKIHPSALPKRLPVMGTLAHGTSNKSSTLTLCSDTDQIFTVERHIPVSEPSSPRSLPKSSKSIAKTQSLKKLL